MLFTAGWGPGYFERGLRTDSPIPRAKGLSDFELPAIDDYDLCLHLACDDERRLADVEAGLVHGAPLTGSDACSTPNVDGATSRPRTTIPPSHTTRAASARYRTASTASL